MKRIFLILVVCLPLSIFAQDGITFRVEKLSKPEILLTLTSSEDVYKELIISDLGMTPDQIERENIDLPFNMVAKSQLPDSMVTYGDF